MAVRKLVERTYIDSDWTGLSTDEKPTENVGINSLFLELDTGDFYYCAKQGSKSVETLFDGTVESISIFDPAVFTPTALPSGEITVVYDVTSYDCQPKSLYVPQTGKTFTYYGATITLGDLPSYDWDEYPFNISLDPDGNVEMVAYFEDSGEHNISISATVETPAVWKKVGEGSSPTPPTPTPAIEGDLENGCTIQPNAWVNNRVDVPVYNMQNGQLYDLYLDGEKIGSSTAQRDELTGGVYVVYEFGTEPYHLTFFNTPGENTTNIEWSVNPPNTAVTIRLAFNGIG